MFVPRIDGRQSPHAASSSPILDGREPPSQTGVVVVVRSRAGVDLRPREKMTG
jgi:hypothetical protein